MKTKPRKNRKDHPGRLARRLAGVCENCNGPRDGDSPRCSQCRRSNCISQAKKRIASIPMRLCWRCLTVHPHPTSTFHGHEDVSERYCYLAPEWNGWPWKEVESDDGWTYPEMG